MQSRLINSSIHEYSWVVNHVGISCGWTPKEARRVIKAITEVMVGALMAGDEVHIRGFIRMRLVGVGKGKKVWAKLMNRAEKRLLHSISTCNLGEG